GVVAPIEVAHLLVHLRGLGGDLPALAVDVGLVGIEHGLAVPEVFVAGLAQVQVPGHVDGNGLHVDRRRHGARDGGVRDLGEGCGGGKEGRDRNGEGQSHGSRLLAGVTLWGQQAQGKVDGSNGPSLASTAPRPHLNPMRLAVFLLLAYVGVRLLSSLSLPVAVAGGFALVAVFLMLPRGWRARRDHGIVVMLNWLTLGFVSWLLVLTLARDLVLVPAALALPAAAFARWSRISALTVLWATPLVTLVGFLMARRVAPVVKVDIPVPGLPEALEGFTIAQISDIHVGPTIKRPFVEKIVERVNRLN